MRKVVLIGLAGLTLAAGIRDVEARSRLRFGGMWVKRPASAASLRGAPSPAVAVRPDIGIGARPTYVVLPAPDAPREPSAAHAAVEGAAVAASAAVPMAPVPAPAPATAKAVVEAAPWCRSQRIVGSGTGFCLIN